MVKEEEIVFDFKKLKKFFAGKKKKTRSRPNPWTFTLLLLLIPIILSIYFRAQPAYLPIADDWAQSSVNNYYKSMISQEINQQFPNLPDENKRALVNQKFQDLLKNNPEQMKMQLEGTAKFFREGLQDEKGDTYLLAIDPYFWYAQARNYIRDPSTGLGDKLDENGEPMFSLRNGRFGRKIGEMNLNAYAGAYLYKILRVFNPDISLMRAMFFLPLILVTLAVIPAFFIGRKIAGDLAGLFAGIIVAVNSTLLGRTPAGFADTDAYNVLFPLMILWMVVEAWEARDTKHILIYSAIGSLFVALFSLTWGGWWFIFNFLLAVMGIYLLYLAFVYRKRLKKGFGKFYRVPSVRNIILTLAGFFLSSFVLVSLFRGVDKFLIVIRGPINVITLKDVAVKTVWPNVLTTVAEFNEIAIGKIVNQMGGKLLFLIAVAGIIWAGIRKDKEGHYDLRYAIILAVWFIGTTYGFTKGVRFAILMVPAFAIAFGVSCGLIFRKAVEWMSRDLNVNKGVSAVVIALILAALLVSPINAAKKTAINEIPSMDDAWYNSLKSIGNASDDAIITSWWDFGHWFYAISERRVTFDGGDQRERIHWVGKSLLVEDENLSMGILRMLNCGQEKAPHVLEGYLGGDTVRAIDVLDRIMVVDKRRAASILEHEGLSQAEIADVLAVTHCDDLIDNYYIASADMVGKSGVWAHFGSWSFRRAAMYQDVVKKGEAEGINLLMSKYGMSEDQANIYYYEITNTKGGADKWVAPWPSYASGRNRCAKDGNELRCANGIIYDTVTHDAYLTIDGNRKHPKSVVWAEIDGLHKKVYDSDVLTGRDDRNLSVAIIPDGKGFSSVLMDSALDDSVFTRLYYYEGHGSRYFEPFRHDRGVTGVDIYIYKVRWEPGEQVIMDEFIGPDEVRASHILVNTSEEAEEIIQLLRGGADFEELARERSIDPSAQANGGDLGWFSKGRMVPQFEDAVFALEDIGDLSGPVQTQFGYHVIKLTGKRDGESYARERLAAALAEKKAAGSGNKSSLIPDDLFSKTI